MNFIMILIIIGIIGAIVVFLLSMKLDSKIIPNRTIADGEGLLKTKKRILEK